jgi:hypothetical protein
VSQKRQAPERPMDHSHASRFGPLQNTACSTMMEANLPEIALPRPCMPRQWAWGFRFAISACYTGRRQGCGSHTWAAFPVCDESQSSAKHWIHGTSNWIELDMPLRAFPPQLRVHGSRRPAVAGSSPPLLTIWHSGPPYYILGTYLLSIVLPLTAYPRASTDLAVRQNC